MLINSLAIIAKQHIVDAKLAQNFVLQIKQKLQRIN